MINANFSTTDCGDGDFIVATRSLAIGDHTENRWIRLLVMEEQIGHGRTGNVCQ
ncbi:hypothetical protein A2U01_0113795, partial [Trifolium medium]|nr:hypothetical protein [Trifolium medium]